MLHDHKSFFFLFTTSAIEWQPEDGGERGRMTAKQVLFFSISGGQEARPRGRAGATAVAVGAPATARAPAAPAPAGAPRFSTPRSTPRSTQHASPEQEAGEGAVYGIARRAVHEDAEWATGAAAAAAGVISSVVVAVVSSSPDDDEPSSSS